MTAAAWVGVVLGLGLGALLELIPAYLDDWDRWHF